MRAVTFHAIADFRVEDVPKPTIERPTDAIVRLTASGIGGTDLQFIRGTFSGMKKSQVLGHEGDGVVEAVGLGVAGYPDRPAGHPPLTIEFGDRPYCVEGGFAQCDRADPGGKRAGTVLFGGPEAVGGLRGPRAEDARRPWADTNLVVIPDDVSDDQAILMSDILPTALVRRGPGAAEGRRNGGRVRPRTGRSGDGRLRLRHGRGPRDRGQPAARPARHGVAPRRGGGELRQGRSGAGHPPHDRPAWRGQSDDAVGVNAQHAQGGPAAPRLLERVRNAVERRTIGRSAHKHGSHFIVGDDPSQAIDRAIDSVRKSGTVSITGVHPPTDRVFPIGKAASKNRTLRMGDGNDRRYHDALLDHVRSGRFDPTGIPVAAGTGALAIVMAEAGGYVLTTDS